MTGTNIVKMCPRLLLILESSYPYKYSNTLQRELSHL